jgi:hypothetical protein
LKTKKEGIVKILCLDQEHSGSRFHRLVLPYKELQGKQIDIGEEKATLEISFRQCNVYEYVLLEDDFKNNDVIVVNWVYFNPIIEISEWKTKYNCALVQDIDDWIELPKSHINSGSNYEKLIPQAVIADVVTTSTERLSAHFIQFNDMVSISPNYLPNKGQFVEKPERKKGKVVLGFCGGVSHYNDWMSIKNVINKICNDKTIQEKCKFVLAGYSDNKWWNEVKAMFDKKNIELEIVNALSVEEYMKAYDSIDILLAPLIPSEYAECKSALKVIECGIKHIPIIGSPIYLTKEVPCVLPADSPKSYLDAILDLINDDKYISVGKEMNEAVMALNHFDKRIENLGSIIEYLMNEDLEKVPENLKITGICYKEEQFTPFNKYLNVNKEFPWRFEYQVMLNKLEEIKAYKETDYVGFLSHKFQTKTGIPAKVLYKMWEEIQNIDEYDFVNLAPTYWHSGKGYLIFSEVQHCGLTNLVIRTCNHLGIKYNDNPECVTYSNFFLMKRDVYIDYLENYIIPAIKFLENEIWEDVNRDAGYVGGLSREELFKACGLTHYNFLTFILERLVLQYISHKKLKFINTI